jgi:hypothetical protein
MTTPTAPVLMACPAGHPEPRMTGTPGSAYFGTHGAMRVECNWCSWIGPECDTEAEAIAAWNIRQTPVDSAPPKR